MLIPMYSMTANTWILVGIVNKPLTGSKCLFPNKAGRTKCFLIEVHISVPLDRTIVALVLRETVDKASRCAAALKSMLFARYFAIP